MSHPFMKLFDRALAKSNSDSNLVLEEAEKLRQKGYSVVEIYGLLTRLQASLIAEEESAIAAEAVEEFSKYIDL